MRRPQNNQPNRLSFNSKLVRLEGNYKRQKPKRDSSFNSKLVRLEEKKGILMTNATIKFQFQTGSIRRAMRMSVILSSISFNSKLVRLEADFGGGTYPKGYGFQFQTGSIRRKIYIVKQMLDREFQFQTGSIRSLLMPIMRGNWYVSIPNWFD